MKETVSNREAVRCKAELVEGHAGLTPDGSAAARRPWFALALVVFAGLLFLWWFDPAEMHLPLCTFYAVTGLPCPGCGATRATHELLHGRLATAWHYNPLWVLAWPLLVSLLGCHVWGRISGGLPARVQTLQKPAWLALAVAAIVFFVLRNYSSL